MTIELSKEARTQAVASQQRLRLRLRLSEIDLEVHEDEFQYWRRQDKLGRGKG